MGTIMDNNITSCNALLHYGKIWLYIYIKRHWAGHIYIYQCYIPSVCIVPQGHLTILWLYISIVAHKKSKTGEYL